MKVLICDDDKISLRVLEFQFKKDGFEVFKAVNGKESQKILAENADIDLLVTDIHTPILGGLELITYVRETLKRDIPIVALAIANFEDNIHHAFDLGANDYLIKPFKMEEISDKIRLLMNK